MRNEPCYVVVTPGTNKISHDLRVSATSNNEELPHGDSFITPALRVRVRYY